MENNIVNELTILFKTNNLKYVEIDDQRNQMNYNLFFNNIIYMPSNEVDIYYLKIFMEINNKNPDILYKIGQYYQENENFDCAIRYYLMAIVNPESGNTYHNVNIDIILNLGICYELVEDYDEMIKYYEMAIDKGNAVAMYNLGCYYDDVKLNYSLAKKYNARSSNVSLCSANTKYLLHMKFFFEKLSQSETAFGSSWLLNVVMLMQ